MRILAESYMPKANLLISNISKSDMPAHYEKLRALSESADINVKIDSDGIIVSPSTLNPLCVLEAMDKYLGSTYIPKESIKLEDANFSHVYMGNDKNLVEDNDTEDIPKPNVEEQKPAEAPQESNVQKEADQNTEVDKPVEPAVDQKAQDSDNTDNSSEQSTEEQADTSTQSNDGDEPPATSDSETTDTDKKEESPKKEPEDPDVTYVATKYPVIYKCMGRASSGNKETTNALAKALAKNILRGSKKDAWIEFINKETNKGTSPVAINQKLLPRLAEIAGVEILKTNGKGANLQPSSIKDLMKLNFTYPEEYGHNTSVPSFGARHLLMTSFGFPMINAGSITMKRIMSNDMSIKEKIPYIKEFLASIGDDPIASILGKTPKEIAKTLLRINNQKGLPMVHKTIKIIDVGSVLQNNPEIECIPINEYATSFESVNTSESAIVEGLFSSKNKNKPSAYGTPITLTSKYLKQYYEEIEFGADPECAELYLEYTSNADIERMKEGIDGSERMTKEQLWAAYADHNNGQLPFILFQQRTSVNEGIRVTDEPFTNGMYLVKTIVKTNGQKNNPAFYFITEDQKKSLFTLG